MLDMMRASSLEAICETHSMLQPGNTACYSFIRKFQRFLSKLVKVEPIPKQHYRNYCVLRFISSLVV